MRQRIENNWACKENDVGTLPVGVTLHLFFTVRLGVVVDGVGSGVGGSAGADLLAYNNEVKKSGGELCRVKVLNSHFPILSVGIYAVLFTEQVSQLKYSSFAFFSVRLTVKDL